MDNIKESYPSSPLLTDAEQHQVLVEWNDTRLDYPKEVCIHELFETQVEQTPEAIAVVFEDEQLTYDELNCRANQLAHYLQKLGAGPEVLVGICLERSLEMIVGVLGILKTGGAYVPLDSTYPKDRLALMLSDSQVPLLLTQNRLLPELPKQETTPVCLDTDWGLISQESTKNPASGSKPENLAYVIYTSGSTGRPKGVMIQHRSVLNLSQGLRQAISAYQQEAQLRVSLNGPLAFDTSVKQFIQLLQGHTLEIIPEMLRFEGSALLSYIQQRQVDVFDCTPSQLKLLISSGLLTEAKPAPKYVLLGGEAIDETTWQALAQAKGIDFYNVYGPTECTVDATICSVQALPDKPTIGRPIANTQVYILDQHLRPVSIGVPGELYLDGIGLARGYLNDPALTTGKFVPNPFSDKPGARLYKTGDLVRYLPDGYISFLGRVDHQVKIRGFRIELGEIETALSQHPAVKEAVVLAPEDAAGDKRLVAYVIPQASTPARRELQTFLKEKLPNYMVPSAFVFLDMLPLTSHGKIDHQALPAPDTYGFEADAAYVAPRTGLESLLADLWREIVGAEKIGIHDDFFDLGGDSLKAAVLVNKLQAVLGEYIYVVALFEAPTIADFASYLNKHYPAAVATRVFNEASAQCSSGKNDPSKRMDSSSVAQMRQMLQHLPRSAEDTRVVGSKNPPAIFILTPPRSGSTLFRVMLAGHPQLFAPPELNLLSFNTLAERKKAFSGENSFRLTGTIRAIMASKGCGVEQAQQIMDDCENRDLTTQEFYRLMQQWVEPKVLIDKSILYPLNLDILKRAEIDFDNALYIHLLRHPYGMIHSFEKVRMDRIFFKDQDVFSAIEMAELTWLICHQNILDFLQEVPAHRQLQVKFEDTVRQPHSVMANICQFLGLELHPDMLQPYKNSEMKMTDGIYATPASRMLGDVKFHEHKAIDPKVADSWKTHYPGDFLGDSTWQVAESLGYERDLIRNQGFEADSVLPTRVGLESIQSVQRGSEQQKEAEQLLARLDQLSDEEVDALLNDVLNDGELR